MHTPNVEDSTSDELNFRRWVLGVRLRISDTKISDRDSGTLFSKVETASKLAGYTGCSRIARSYLTCRGLRYPHFASHAQHVQHSKDEKQHADPGHRRRNPTGQPLHRGIFVEHELEAGEDIQD